MDLAYWKAAVISMEIAAKQAKKRNKTEFKRATDFAKRKVAKLERKAGICLV